MQPEAEAESPDTISSNSNSQTTGVLTTISSAIPSFTVLNSDTLKLYAKPNAIVRPVRRTEPLPGPLDSQGSLKIVALPGDAGNDIEHFAKELDRKLRRLKTRNKSNSVSSQNVRAICEALGLEVVLGSSHDLTVKRPLFITTVPTGVFLAPTKEPAPAPTKRVYAFASRPRVLPKSAEFESNMSPTRGREFATRVNGIRAFTKFMAGNKHPERECPCPPSEPPAEPYKNVMYDRRVVRGSNFPPNDMAWNPYFSYAGLLSGKSEVEKSIKQAESRRRQMLRKKCQSRNQRNILGTPPPVAGRKHEPIQTEKYLEELFDRPPEFDANTQTDLFLERPKSPPYVPAKIGVDVATGIEEGELFDFDKEVQPILETLVGHCVEQGLMEVAHEEEVAELRKQQEEYLAIREADLAELRRLEAEELRLQAEKERRLRQDCIAKELDAKMQERVTAAKLLQGHIASLLPEVLENLEPLTDSAKKEHLEKTICPWLTKEVAEEVGHIIDSREILTVIIQEIIKQRAAIYANYKEDEPRAIESVEEGVEKEAGEEQ